MASIGMWLTFLVVLAAGAYGEDCSDEHIKQVADECKLQLREQFTDNFTIDCTGGVVQDYINCLMVISDCANVIGITEVTLSEVYSFNSKMLSGITGPPDPNSPVNSGGRTRKDCSLKCGWFYCKLTCGRFYLEIGVKFQKREAESNPAERDFMCTLVFPESDKEERKLLETGGCVAFKPAVLVSLLTVIAAAASVF